MLEVNLTGTWLVSRTCLPWMQKEAAPTIVNIASAAGLLPNAPGLTAYAASKGGVVNLDASHGGRARAGHPGQHACARAWSTRRWPKASAANVGNYALKRIAEPAEIARAILFLTSADSRT